MHIGVIGTSYLESSISERELLSIDQDQYCFLQNYLIQHCQLEELVIISTCNRVELYYIYTQKVVKAELIKSTFLKAINKNIDVEIQFYHYDQINAVRHLFRVISGLKSIALGEPQIFGQVKEAYTLATKDYKQSKIFNFVFQQACAVAKRVRNETEIAKIAISISYIASTLAKKIFTDLIDKTILVIGAGNMAELVLIHMTQEKQCNVIIANRTIANAVELAEKYQGSAIRIDTIEEHLYKADIIVSSTATNQYIITKEMIERAMAKRKHKPLFIIDIALPRDVDPEINKIASVYLYNIDDFQAVVDENLEERKKAALEAEKIIEEELIKFQEKKKIDKHATIIKNFRKHFQNQCEFDFMQTINQTSSLSLKQKKLIKKLSSQFINRLLHQPTLKIKKKIIDNDQLFIETMENLFGNEEQNEEDHILKLNKKK